MRYNIKAYNRSYPMVVVIITGILLGAIAVVEAKKHKRVPVRVKNKTPRN